MSASPAPVVLERNVDQARQDATDLVDLVRRSSVEAVAAHLAALTPARKDALLVALARAVDVDRTARQGCSWLDAPHPLPTPPRWSVRPRALDVRRFARAHGLSDDQVWQAIVDLHAGAAAGHIPPADQP